ncbi:MAG: hypothetical protein IPJ71_06910 [Bdellovibrionales bacterium]|nr:hypothetical protein [Bdellovibrionales bacterium]
MHLKMNQYLKDGVPRLFPLLICGVFSGASGGIFGRAQADGPLETLSQVAYKLSGGESCSLVIESKAQLALSKLEQECESRTPPIARLKSTLAEITNHSVQSSEDRFFATLANQHSLELSCAADFAKQVAEGEEISNKNILSFLPELRKHKQALAQSTSELASSPSITNKTCPLKLKELSEIPNSSQKMIFNSNTELCRNIIRHRSAFQAILSSVPLSGTPAIQSLINRYISLPDGADLEALEKSLGQEIQKAYRSTESLLRSESSSLSNAAKRGGQSFDRSSRKSLLSDPAVTEKVINSSSDRETMKALACHADASYGSGAEALDASVMIGSFVMSGVAAVAVRGASIASRIGSVAQSARAGGFISINSARALQVAALAMDSELALTQIDGECLSKNSPKIVDLNLTNDKGQCVSAPTVGQLRADNCILTATLAALSFGLAVLPDLGKLGSKALGHTQLSSPVARSEISEMLKREITENEMNAIEKAHLEGAGEIGENGGPAGVGNYTFGQKRRKSKILKEAGLSDSEIRVLMEKGRVGFSPSDARQLFAQRYLNPESSTLPRQREFREVWADTNKLNTAIFEKRVLSIPIDDSMVAARLISENPNGTLVVELVDGQRRTLGSRDLPLVRFASDDTAAQYNKLRLESLNNPNAIAEERNIQLRRAMSPRSDLSNETLQLRRDWVSGDLGRQENGPRIIDFVPDGKNQKYPGVLSKVFNDGRIQVMTPDGKSRVLSESEMASLEYSKNKQSPLFSQPRLQPGRSAQDSIRGLFQDQPGVTIGPGSGRAMSYRTAMDSSGNQVEFNIVPTPGLRQSAANSGLIKEYTEPISASQLKPGNYTYLYTRDGKFVMGEVDDSFEIGVKHVDLANGREGVLAGELRVLQDGSYRFNIESGAFTRQLIKKHKVPEADLKRRAQETLEFHMGRPGEYSQGTFLSGRTPDIKRITDLCRKRDFFSFNEDGCCRVAKIGCH